MVKTYKNIFARCGLDVVIVDADSGGIGGKESKEFVLIADSGDDTILISPDESYAAILEKAEFIKTDYSEDKILDLLKIGYSTTRSSSPSIKLGIKIFNLPIS